MFQPQRRAFFGDWNAALLREQCSCEPSSERIRDGAVVAYVRQSGPPATAAEYVQAAQLTVGSACLSNTCAGKEPCLTALVCTLPQRQAAL